MASNLHTRFLRCLAAVVLVATVPQQQAVDPCPPETAALVTSGWQAYRADSIQVAAERFARADALCPASLDAKVGRGYAALRLGNTGAADSLFALVTLADSGNGDAWDGLTITRYRAGDTAGALAAGRRALALHPDNRTTREIVTALDPDWERRDRAETPIRAPSLRVDARVRGDLFEIPSGRSWKRFYVQGMNLGVALPGKFPSEFPTDSATYADWLASIAGMHANTVRLYTILPPSFYRALAAWNSHHPDQALWLLHGVWTELPPDHNFDDVAWRDGFRQEMRNVVDLVHGQATIPARPGHASGRYDADVSRWVLGYIIGREWEPFAVKAFDTAHPRPSTWRGRYLLTRPGATAIDLWMARQCDYLLSYEIDRYNAIRPIAYSNWPTLDPLRHPTETTAGEEGAWRKRVGRELPREPVEYENDAVSLDATLVRATPANPAGWFASYHAYPYYPDFMLYDPAYNMARSPEGRSNYFGYLTALKKHHRDVPLLIAEYGVPSSRGIAHLQPQGWHHGGHDEIAQARIDARLTREIKASGAAGAVVFAWLDEWFKQNWIVSDYEIPAENTRLWHNMMDAEQNYGMLGMYAGSADVWDSGTPVLSSADAADGKPTRIWLGADESYLHVRVEFAGLAGKPFPFREREILLGFDTFRSDMGQRAFPDRLVEGDVGFEFLARIRDTTDAELRVTPDYNPYAGANAIVNGDDFGLFRQRPIIPAPRRDGEFDSLFVITNRARFARDGTFFPAQGYNRGRLRYGTAEQSSLSDWYWDRTAGMLQLRLPWGLLNVTDPSTATILYEERDIDKIGAIKSDGIRVGAIVARKYTGGTPGSVLGSLPVLDNGGWSASQFRSWQWPTWTEPRYHARMKPVYDSLRAVWSRP